SALCPNSQPLERMARLRWYLASRPSLRNFNSDAGHAGADHAQHFGCGSGNVDDAAACKRPAVIDPHDHLLARLENRHTHTGAETYGPMGTRKCVFIECLTRCSSLTAEVVGRQPDFVVLFSRCLARALTTQRHGQVRKQQSDTPNHLR